MCIKLSHFYHIHTEKVTLEKSLVWLMGWEKLVLLQLWNS